MTARYRLLLSSIQSVIVSTISPKAIVRFWSCNKAVANVFLHKAEPSSATGTGQYLLD